MAVTMYLQTITNTQGIFILPPLWVFVLYDWYSDKIKYKMLLPQ